MRKSTFKFNNRLHLLFQHSSGLTNGAGWIDGNWNTMEYLRGIYYAGSIYVDYEFESELPNYYEYQVNVPFSFMKFRIGRE